MKGEKMALWLVIFVACFGMAVAAVYIYNRSEDTENTALRAAIGDLKNDVKKISVPDLSPILTAIGEVKTRQEALEEKCIAVIDERTGKLMQRIDAVVKENEILKVRLSSVDKRFRELPRTVSVKIEEPVKFAQPAPIQVEILHPPKTQGQGTGALLDRAGVKKEKTRARSN